MPLCVSDLSKREANLATSSGFNGGTLIGPGPEPGGGLVVDKGGAAGGIEGGGSTEMPLNFGKGPAVQSRHKRNC